MKKEVDSTKMLSRVPIDSRYTCNTTNNVFLPYESLITYVDSEQQYSIFKNNMFSFLKAYPTFYKVGDDIAENTAELQKYINILNGLGQKGCIVNYDVPFEITNINIPSGFKILDNSDTSMYRIYDNNSKNETNTIMINREVNITGGDENGYVVSPVYINNNINCDNNNFQWGLTMNMKNYSNLGENVGIYSHVEKRNCGSTWASCFELREYANDYSKGAIGLEVDIFANGSPTNNYRVGVDIVSGKNLTEGEKSTMYSGLRIGSFNGDFQSGDYIHGIMLNSNFTNAISIHGTSIWGINFTGECDVGINFVSGNITDDCIRMKQKQKISWSENGDKYISFNNSFVISDGVNVKGDNIPFYAKDSSSLIGLSLNKNQCIEIGDVQIKYNETTNTIDFIKSGVVVNTISLTPTTTSEGGN